MQEATRKASGRLILFHFFASSRRIATSSSRTSLRPFLSSAVALAACSCVSSVVLKYVKKPVTPASVTALDHEGFSPKAPLIAMIWLAKYSKVLVSRAPEDILLAKRRESFDAISLANPAARCGLRAESSGESTQTVLVRIRAKFQLADSNFAKSGLARAGRWQVQVSSANIARRVLHAQ